HVRSFKAQHDWQLNVRLLGGLDHTRGERVHPQDAAKDINEHRLHVLVAEQDLERVCDLLRIGAAADIQEVSRHAPRILDDVHGRHCQPGAIHHATDVAVELDVIQAVL